MKFISLPSIRSTVAQLISNASLAFALATFTGVTSSPAWAEANLTPQQLDEEYEQEYLLYTVAEKVENLLWWRKTKDDRSKPAYGTTSFPQYQQKLMDTGLIIYSLKEKQEEMDKAFYVEKKYGHLSNSELEVKYKELAERTCWNSLLIAEAGGSKALFGLFNNKLLCGPLVERSFAEKYRFKKKASSQDEIEIKRSII